MTTRQLPSTMSRLPCSRVFCILMVLAITVAGCARVDATRDFQRAAQVVSERTGAEDIYDPAADALAESKVRALLAETLTVDKAVRVALLNNKAFQGSFQSIGASRADVVQSGLLTNPSVTFMVRFPE